MLDKRKKFNRSNGSAPANEPHYFLWELPLNLLFDRWIPVRCRSGLFRDIAPIDLADSNDPPIELVAPRPEFNGALAQFLIGVLQTTVAVTRSEWADLYKTPLSPTELRAIFEPDRAAFDLENESGPAFMQEFDAQSLSAAEVKPLDALLIDSPGANTVEHNADLFIKRDRITVLSPAAAAMALLSLQINAPSGGAGHRTSLRGGGPLTTLIWPRALDGVPTTLWQKIWSNVLVLSEGEKSKKRADIWPWLAVTRTSEKSQVIQGGPLGLNYFACPRRIRLRWGDGSGHRCAVFGTEHPRVATAWVTQNYGANYASNVFKHPLSPYYRLNPNSEWLPLHPRSGGFNYREFLSVVASDQNKEPARVVCDSMLHSVVAIDIALAKRSIWAFGFEMDNMKARAWHEAYFPLYVGVDQGRLAEYAEEFISAAVLAREKLARGLRESWNQSAVGNTQAIEQQFWESTEAQFYQRLESTFVLDTQGVGLEAYIESKHKWIKHLRSAMSKLFERYAEPNLPDVDALARAANARKKMLNDFYFSACKQLRVPILKKVTTPIETVKSEDV